MMRSVRKGSERASWQESGVATDQGSWNSARNRTTPERCTARRISESRSARPVDPESEPPGGVPDKNPGVSIIAVPRGDFVWWFSVALAVAGLAQLAQLQFINECIHGG